MNRKPAKCLTSAVLPFQPARHPNPLPCSLLFHSPPTMSAPEEPEVLPKRRITADGELGQLHNKYSRKRRRTKEEIAADNAREAEEKAEKDHQAAKAHAQRLRIAAKKEDEIQRREDQIRANSTRPDLVTMATHRKYHARAAEEAGMALLFDQA